MTSPAVEIQPELFEFREETHQYFYAGSEIPGVSRILMEAGHVKLDHIPPEVLEKARQIGTAAHIATEIYDRGGVPKCDPLVQPCLDSYLAFLETRRPKILAIEKPILIRVGNNLVGGIVDRLWELDGVLMLPDLKTSYRIQPSHKIQVCLYRLGTEIPELVTPALLKLNKDGRIAKLTILTQDEIEEHTQEGVRIVESWYYKRRHRIIDGSATKRATYSGTPLRGEGAEDISAQA